MSSDMEYHNKLFLLGKDKNLIEYNLTKTINNTL